MSSLSLRPLQLGLMIVGACAFSIYVTYMLHSIVPMSLAAGFTLWFVVFSVGILLALISAFGSVRAQMERKLSDSQKTIEFHTYESQNLCDVSRGTKERALILFGLNPETGKVEERVYYLAREHVLPVVFQTILICVAGATFTWLTSSYRSYQTAGGDTPKRLRDDEFVVIDLPVGVPMAVILCTMFALFFVWVRWESTLHMITTHYLIKLRSYPAWLFIFFNDRAPNMPINKIDFGNPHRGIMGRIFGYGWLEQDAAPQGDKLMRKFKRIRKFMYFVKLLNSLKVGSSVPAKTL